METITKAEHDKVVGDLKTALDKALKENLKLRSKLKQRRRTTLDAVARQGSHGAVAHPL